VGRRLPPGAGRALTLRLRILAAAVGNAASDIAPARPPSPFDALKATPAAAVVPETIQAVRRAGTQLTLDGQPFRFTGLNIFNAANVDSALCWYAWGNGDLLDRALGAIGDGQTVFRIWLYQRMATVGGQRDWTAFEHTLEVARNHGERVIVTLGNQWKDCEGTGARFKTEDWYQSGYKNQPAPGLPQSYRDWVAEVVSRYRHDNTIFAWQLMNEPSDQPSEAGGCSPTAGATFRAFASDMGILIKGLDPDHLISVGTLGGGECGSAGNDYQALYAIPEIDLCNFNDYSPAAPAAPKAPAMKAKAKECSAKADAQGLHGKARKDFREKCKKS